MIITKTIQIIISLIILNVDFAPETATDTADSKTLEDLSIGLSVKAK